MPGHPCLDVLQPDIIRANNNIIKYHIAKAANVTIAVYDNSGKQVNVLLNRHQDAGTYTTQWMNSKVSKGIYYVTAMINGTVKQTVKLVKE